MESGRGRGIKRKDPPSDSYSSESEAEKDRDGGGGDEEVMRGVKRIKIEVDTGSREVEGVTGSVSGQRLRHQPREEADAADCDEDSEEHDEGEDGTSTIRAEVKHKDR